MISNLVGSVVMNDSIKRLKIKEFERNSILLKLCCITNERNSDWLY